MSKLIPAAADDGRERVLRIALRRVAGALEREQGHGGGGCVVVVAAAVVVRAGEAPLAGAELPIGEPAEPERDGAFGLAGAAIGLEERVLHARLAAGERDADGRRASTVPVASSGLGAMSVASGEAKGSSTLRQVLGGEDVLVELQVVRIALRRRRNRLRAGC